MATTTHPMPPAAVELLMEIRHALNDLARAHSDGDVRGEVHAERRIHTLLDRL